MKRLLNALLIAFCLLWCWNAWAACPGTPPTSNFLGNTDTASPSDRGITNANGSRFTPDVTGTLNVVCAYLPFDFGSTNVRTAVYANTTTGCAGGAPNCPGAKLEESTSAAAATTAGWYSTSYSGATTLTAGTYYWLKEWTDSNQMDGGSTGSAANQTQINATSTYPSWPATDINDFNGDYTMIIYGEITPAGGGGGRNNMLTLGVR